MNTFTHDILELKSWHEQRRPREQRRLVVDPELAVARTSRRSTPDYVPTPAEIQASCLEIQSEWSPAERLRRAGRIRLERPLRILHLATLE